MPNRDDKDFIDYPAPGHTVELTERELAVLQLVMAGLVNKEIGARLYISDQTVKNHMTAIMRKLHVTTRTEAVIVALRRGLIEL